MKSLIEFSQMLLQDMGERCGVSTTRDQKTVAARVEAEGLSFLTITLPTFAESLERSLDSRYVGGTDDGLFMGFSRDKTGLPRFLGGFLRQIFSPDGGSILAEPSVEAVRAVRQYCLAFKRINLPCTPEREKRAMRRFIECEQDVARWNQENHLLELEELTRASDVLYGDLFQSLDLAVEAGTLVPKHGPGSTADHVLGNSKFTIRGWSRRLDTVFPIADWVLPSVRHWECLDGVDIFEPGLSHP